MESIHYGFDVHDVLNILLRKRESEGAHPELNMAVSYLQKLEREGIRIASTCPQAAEVEPGVWVCLGHHANPKRRRPSRDGQNAKESCDGYD